MAINNETLFKQPARMFDGVNLVLCSTRPGRFDPGEYYLTNGDHFVIFLAHSGNTTLEPGKPTGEDFDSEDDRALGPGLLWPVGSHPARETFDKGLGSCILELAVEAGLRPASVGLYRQGHGPPTDDEQCPVTILVILFLHPSEYTMETLGGFIAPMPELIKHAESFVDMVHNILDEL